MIDGDEWKTGVDAPTPQDMIKFASQHAKLLVQLPWGYTPSVIEVHQVLNNGEYFSVFNNVMFSTGETWYRTSDMRVLAIFPSSPTVRKINETGTLTASDLNAAYEALVKKPKRKKSK